MKGAIIGYGFIASKGHVPAYLARKDVELCAVADFCAPRAEEARRALPQAKIYSSWRELLEKEAESLDFVDICAPPYVHEEITLEALKRGLHVLCEKPLATSYESALAMARQAKRSNRVLFPCHNYKHAPVVRSISEIIQSGRIGRVHTATLCTFRNTHAKGVEEWEKHWRREKRLSGGGIAMDHGSHSFYLTFDWMKAMPTAISAKFFNLQSDRYDTEDNFSAVLTFPRGWVNLTLSWTAGVRKVIYALQGDRGAITVDDDRLELALQESTSGPDIAQGAVKWSFENSSVSSHWMDASHVSWFNSLFDEFQKTIQMERWVGPETIDALMCVQTIEAAYRSAEQGCREVALVSPFTHLES